MKNLIAKLKGLNYKQVAVDHGEKGLFGLIGLFVLFCFVGTSWSRYDKEPGEFLKKVDEGTRKISASTFPDERKKEFQSSREIMDAVQALQTSVEAGRFVYSTDWFWPMYPQVERGREPTWLALKDPIVHLGKAIIVEQPIDPNQGLIAGVVEDSSAAKVASTATDEDDNAPRRPSNSDLAPRAAPAAAPAAAGRGRSPAVADAAPDPGAGVASGSGGSTMLSMMGGGRAAGPVMNSRGARFAAVRAVFPLKEQIDAFAAAMHKQPNEAAGFVNFMDFELQRQVAQPGKNPWTGEWEKVDLQAALDVLDRVDFDVELVDLAFTDAVFTMPMPRRVSGFWTKYASHPLIKQLSEDLAEAQQQVLEQMVKKAEEQQKLESKSKPGGFAGKQHNAREMRSQMGGAGMMGAMNQANQQIKAGDFQQYSGSSGGGYGSEGAGGRLSSAVNTFGNEMQKNDGRMSKYLLFRYFDFSVTPGNAYRYRARLILKNPNFGQPVEALIDESVAALETRETPWSEPTPMVIVPEEQKIFLAKVAKARPDTGLPTASLDIFQWFADAGTSILVNVDALQLGQFIGGRKETEVLRPEVSMKKEEIPVFTGSILADISGAPISELDVTEHADLKIDAKRLKQLGTVDKALLVDRYGQLKTLDPKENGDDQAQSQKIVESERKPWEHLKNRTTASASSNDINRLLGGSAPDSGSGSAGSDSMMQKMMQGQASSPLKKGAAGATKSNTKPGRGGRGASSSSSGSGSGT